MKNFMLLGVVLLIHYQANANELNRRSSYSKSYAGSSTTTITQNHHVDHTVNNSKLMNNVIPKIKKITDKKENSKKLLKENLEDFQRVSILKSVLDHCPIEENSPQKKNWLGFIVDYSKFIINKNRLTDEEIVSVISNAEISVENKFGKNVPLSICEQAYDKSDNLYKEWESFKKEGYQKLPDRSNLKYLYVAN